MQKYVISLFKSYTMSSDANEKCWQDLDINFLEYHKLDMIYYYSCLQSGFNTSYQSQLETKKRIIEEKNSLYYNNAKLITKQLDDLGVSHVYLKGLACILNIYKERWLRYFSDIDMLLEKLSLNTIEGILLNLGYMFGKMDKDTTLINIATREEILYQRTFTHEMYNMVRKEADDWASNIDVNFLFSWNGAQNQSNDILLSHLAKHIIYSYGVPIFDDITNMIHFCCHLYNEAVFFALDKDFLFGDPKEIQLHRVFDIAILSQRLSDDDFAKVVQISKQMNCLDKVKFSIKVVNMLLGNDSITGNSELLNYDDIDINLFYDKDLNRLFWPITLLDRVFNLDKKCEVVKRIFPSI